MLLHRIEVHRVRLRAEIRRVQAIFDLHYSFPRIDKRHKLAALRVLETLLVQRPVEVGQQVGYLVEVVL